MKGSREDQTASTEDIAAEIWHAAGPSARREEGREGSYAPVLETSAVDHEGPRESGQTDGGGEGKRR